MEPCTEDSEQQHKSNGENAAGQLLNGVLQRLIPWPKAWATQSEGDQMQFEIFELDFELQDTAPAAKSWLFNAQRPLHTTSAATTATAPRFNPIRHACRLSSHAVKFSGCMLSSVVQLGTAAVFCSFFPRASKLMGAAAVLGTGHLAGKPLIPWRAARVVLAPLRPVRKPAVAFAAMGLVMPAVSPGLWRVLCYWQRLLPIFARYCMVARRCRRLTWQGQLESAEQAWAEQHQAGAEAIASVLLDLKGFYLKLGQILATKTEMLPPPYIATLSSLFDQLPAARFHKIQAAIKRELQAVPDVFFRSIEPMPLASATIAQVHRAVTVDGQAVVVKVQHAAARRAMQSDLANMALCCKLLEACNINLGFDLGSLVREYHAQVPLEFDFLRELHMSDLARSALHCHAMTDLPLLQRVIVPKPLPALCTKRLLTQEFVDGIPLLDVAQMDLAVRQQLMSALILAYGIMILEQGCFHTDPHPGNLMAVVQEGVMKVALLDWGQVKQMEAGSRLRYAMLVAALASRDDELVTATLHELGVHVENCTDEFAAIAGYILFDTRMDFPEAMQGPLDPDANEGWRTAKVPHLPQELFMIVRVITLLRGVLASLNINISSALMWRPLALNTIASFTTCPRYVHICYATACYPQYQQQQHQHQHQQQHGSCQVGCCQEGEQQLPAGVWGHAVLLSTGLQALLPRLDGSLEFNHGIPPQHLNACTAAPSTSLSVPGTSQCMEQQQQQQNAQQHVLYMPAPAWTGAQAEHGTSPNLRPLMITSSFSPDAAAISLQGAAADICCTLSGRKTVLAKD